jgi:hypothetical protein
MDYLNNFLMRDGMGRAGLQVMCEEMKRRSEIKSFVEVGCFSGESALVFCKNLPDATVYCVDPWAKGYHEQDASSHQDMDLVEKAFDERTRSCSNIRKMKGISEDFSSLPELSFVDVVYIDACHTYESAKKDILFWLPRCKIAICGHDYSTCWPGVRQAVDEIFGKPDGTYCDGSWLKWV